MVSQVLTKASQFKDDLGLSYKFYKENNGSIKQYYWQGKVFSVPNKTYLFDVKGYNLLRVGLTPDKDANAFRYNRECALFFKDGKPLLEWQNNEVLPIINCPVQANLGKLNFVKLVKDKLVVKANVSYPHPYKDNSELKDYFNNSVYRAKEIYVSNTDKNDARVGQWYRLGPWLPWMNLGNENDTKLYWETDIYNCRSLSDINPFLKDLVEKNIDFNLPLYPTEEDNRTSLHFFKDYFTNKYIKNKLETYRSYNRNLRNKEEWLL